MLRRIPGSGVSTRSLSYVLALVSALAVQQVVAQTAFAATHSIEGRVVWPDTVTTASKVKLKLSLESGKEILGWPRADGSFVLSDIPEGVHLLDVVAIGLVYPQIRLEVNGAFPGKSLATLAENQNKIIPPPLTLRPNSLAEYFEKQEPFNIIGFLKTPYGMMAAFGIFAVFILPKLRIDDIQEEGNKSN